MLENVERSVQTASTPFNIFENKGNVVWTLNESLNLFKFDSKRLQHFFAPSTMLNDMFKRPQHLIQQTVERMRMLNKMLKSFNRAFIY